jgi:hypothetical protein
VKLSGDDSGCVFCDALLHDEGRDLVLVEGATCFVILNL